MGITAVEQVVQWLNAAGIRAEEAYPGQEMTRIERPAAAVCLDSFAPGQGVVKVRVMIYSPWEAGGSACETAAWNAALALQAKGADCVQETCGYNGRADMFYTPVVAQFHRAELMAKPLVSLGDTVLANVTEFTAEQETDDPASTALASCKWQFALEERFLPEDAEPAAPQEPFTMTVTRSGMKETFANCRWISVQRKDSGFGITQIRKGTAKSRSIEAIT